MLGGVFALLGWFVLLPAIYLLGSFFRKWLSEEDIALRGIFYVAFGLGILSYFIVLIGSLNALTLWPIAGLLVLAVLLCYRYLPEYKRWIVSLYGYLKWPEEGAFLKITLGVLLASLVVTIFLTFLPEIANDSLCYHLNLPKLFAQNTSIMPMKYDLKSYQSQFMECLYTIGIFLHSVPIAKLFHWLTGFLLVLSVMIVIEKKTGKRSLAVFMGTMLWLTPTLFNQVAMTSNDGATAFFVWLSFYALLQGLDRPVKAKTPEAIFLVSGLLLGFAASCKYLALMFGVPMGLWLASIFAFQPARRGSAGRALVLFCGGVFLGCSFWFIRNWILAGHPLYPIFPGKFGGPGLYAEQNYSTVGVPKTLVSFLMLPFSVVFSPDSFERYSWAGPFYLLLLPFAFLGAVRNTKARFAMEVSLISGILWFLIAQNIRFLLPVFPLIIFAAACGIYDFGSFFSRPWLTLAGKWIAILNLLLLLAIGGYHYRVHLQALLQGWTAEQFLTRLERSFPAAQWVNRNLPLNARIYSASEVRHFYFNRPIIDEVSYYRVERYSDKLKPSEFRAKLHELGITHVMRTLDARGEVPAEDPSYRIIDLLLTDGRMTKLLFEIQSQNIRETQFRYVIYELLPGDKV